MKLFRWLWVAATLAVLANGFHVAMYVVPADVNQGDLSRILYYHVPTWCGMGLFFTINVICSIVYLAIRNRNPLRALKTDALALASAANVKAPYASVNPYCFKEPVSPHIAADVEGIRIDVGTILQEFDALKSQADCVIVEGAGGWLVPIGNGQSMADVAVALGLPVIMVVGLRLGCLNHAALTAQAINASGLRLDHWIANEVDPAFARREENIATLAGLLGEPLAMLPHVQNRKIPELPPEVGTRLAETL